MKCDILDGHDLQRLGATSEPLQLAGLLCSSGTPGRGLYKLEQAPLDHLDNRATELVGLRQYVEAGLRATQSRQGELRAAITASRSRFSEARAAAGISDELWQSTRPSASRSSRG